MNHQSKIAIFCGKGGVGKTTLAVALGLKYAAAGRRTLLVTSHPLPELAIALSLDGLAQKHPESARNLFVVHLDPKELLSEVVRENFPVEWVANLILESRIYGNLIEVAPGLKEFYFLARLQRLAERKTSGVPDYEVILWDAPATGHFLATLRAARNFEVYLTGPLASAGAELNRFFSSAEHISLVPVTTLEEMAIAETLEMCGALRHDFNLNASTVAMNLVSPLVNAPDRDVQQLPAGSQNDAMRFAVERGLLERKRAADLREIIHAPAIAVERVRHPESDLDLLARVGAHLDALSI